MRFILLITTVLLFNSCMLFQPTAKQHNARAIKKHQKYDAIIVPGVPFNEPKWDVTMEIRVLWAIHLYKKGLTEKIIMSGSSVYSPYVEANIMKLYAERLGVPSDDIIIEDKAQHSTENLWNSYKLAKSLGLKKIALCSDPFQTRMLYRFGKKRLKGDVAYFPIIFDTLKTMPRQAPTIDYASCKIDDFKSIVETQSFWKRMRGTMGKNINYKEN
jgi:uncharacterized SAM-binding protein YcdF (DUF218 family)